MCLVPHVQPNGILVHVTESSLAHTSRVSACVGPWATTEEEDIALAEDELASSIPEDKPGITATTDELDGLVTETAVAELDVGCSVEAVGDPAQPASAREEINARLVISFFIMLSLSGVSGAFLITVV